jgi:hypothetical protein
MAKEIYRTIKVNRSIPIRVNVKESIDDVLALLDGSSYGDLFASSRQKKAAWEYWIEYYEVKRKCYLPRYSHNTLEQEESFYDELFRFFFNAPIDADFIKYCAKKEGENPVAYVIGLLS